MAVARTLLLLHGFTHTGRSWDGVVAALGERYRPIAPDIRGHGGASQVQPVTLDSVIRDLDRLAADPVTLAGYSMGGRIALHYALARPGRVQRLVLIGASPGIADPAQRAARRRTDEQLAADIERMTIEQFARSWAQTPVLAGQPAEVAAKAHADRLRNTPAGLARALRGLGAGALPSLWERLASLSMPVALIAGERDQKFRAIAEQMTRTIGEARVALIPEAGHAVHLEMPSAVAELL